MTLGEREASDLERSREYIAAARQDFLAAAKAEAANCPRCKCPQCDGMGVVVVDYGSPSQPVRELVCDRCHGTGRG